MENKEKTFREIVQAMTAKEIIMAMVEGLKNPALNVNMDSYLSTNGGGICCGCAATNAICFISGRTPAPKDLSGFFESKYILELEISGVSENVWSKILYGEYLKEEAAFIRHFETAINALRLGSVVSYNVDASVLGIALIKEHPYKILTALTTDNYLEHLQEYEELAEMQP